MTIALLTAFVLSGAYDDPTGRVRVKPPGKWRYVRALSTLETPAFKLDKRRKGVATARILTYGMPNAVGLPGVHRELLLSAKSSGATVVEDRPSRLAGWQARELVFTSTVEGRKRTVVEWFTQNFGLAYVIRFEVDGARYKSFRKDIRAFASAVRFSRGSQKKSVAAAESPLVGTWARVGNPNSTIVLGADGSLAMDTGEGSYAVSQNTFVALLRDGGQEVYRWRIAGNRLTLVTRGRRARYKRIARD